MTDPNMAPFKESAWEAISLYQICQHCKRTHRSRKNTRGIPRILELSFGGRAPCSTGFPQEVSVLETHLYQCTSWCCCERLHSTSRNFFWRLFQSICPFYDGWFTSVPAYAMLSVQQFLTKNVMTPHLPPSLLTGSHPKQLFFVSPHKKSPQRHFADMEEVKIKKPQKC